jgi:hypothetical protein
MVFINPESSPVHHAAPAADGNTPQRSATDHHQPPIKVSQLLVFAFIAALLAGVASLLVGEVILSRYQSDLNPPIQNNPSPEDVRRWKDARLYSATFTFTTLGGLLGFTLGLAGGLARRSVSASAMAAILGLLLGSTLAAAVSLILVSTFFKNHDPQ